MRKHLNFELTKEEDGVKAQIDIVEKDVHITACFSSCSMLSPVVLGEESLLILKDEVNTLLTKIKEIKKEESPVKQIIKKLKK